MNLLAIDKASTEQRTLMAELNESLFESLTAGIGLVADSGHGIGRQIMDKFNQFDQRYLMRIFTRNQQRQSDMKRLFEELIIADHLSNVYSKNKPGLVNPAFAASTGDEGDVVINVEKAILSNGNATAVTNSAVIANGVGDADGLWRRGRGSPTATPPALDLNYLLPAVQHNQQHRESIASAALMHKVSVKHSVAPPVRLSGHGDELNILRDALFINKVAGADMLTPVGEFTDLFTVQCNAVHTLL